MKYQRQIIGYHGCTVERFESALLSGVHPPYSAETYDWLGRGVYFWEHGPERARAWAKAKCVRAGIEESNARVLGAVIQLGDCLDLLDTAHTGVLEKSYKILMSTVGELAHNSSESRKGDVMKRELDCRVINFAAHGFQTVRGAFWEGGPAFPGAVVQKMSHIQISVRDLDCVIGYFKPQL